MLYTTEKLRGTISLNLFPRIMTHETVNYIDLIPVKTSQRLGYKIIALEDAYKYMNQHSVDFNVFLEEMAYINSITPSQLAFSVQPCSIYFNKIIQEMYKDLKEENVPLYLSVSHDSKEYKFIDMICEECIRANSTHLFDYIFTESFLGSFIGGSVNGAVDAVGDTSKGIINIMGEKVRQGIMSGVQDKLNNYIGGKLGIDGTKEVWENDENGNLVKKKVTDINQNMHKKIKNNKLLQMDFFKNNPNLTNNITEFLSDRAKDVRNGLTQGVLNQLQNLVGIDPNQPFDIDNVIDTITQKVNTLRGRPGSGGNTGIINALINKLIALKNHLLGHKR